MSSSDDYLLRKKLFCLRILVSLICYGERIVGPN